MATKLDKVTVYSKGLPSTESFDASIMWSGDHVMNEKHHTSASARHMATKLDRVVAFDKGLFTWSF